MLNDRITYADFFVYQVLNDEGLTREGRVVLEGYPRLKRLVEGFEDRAGVRAFLGSERYRE